MVIRAASKEKKSATNVVQAKEKGRVSDSVLFDWAVIAVCSWLLGGAYTDAWAHNHIRLETFFTPWHAVLYSGLLSVVIFLLGSFIRNLMRGYSFQHAIPVGYDLSLLGVVLFVFGGIGDLIWHTLFGIELSIDGALSPTHITLSFCLVLIVSGPFRAAWHRRDASKEKSLIRMLPMLLSLAFTLSAITLISQFAHPFVFTWPVDPQQKAFGNQALAVVSIVLQTIILMGLVLLAIRRWTLPFGALTLIFTLNMIFLSFMQDHYFFIPVAAVTGLTADLLLRFLKPSAVRLPELRIFAFTVPIVLYLLYFLTLKLVAEVNWTIHLWLGTTVVAGIAGYALSYLLVPPRIPAEQANG